MTRATQDTDPLDSYMAARLGKPVAQVTAALDADEHDARTEAIISEARKRPALDGQPVSEAAADFMRNAKARNARTQAGKDASCRAAAERVFAFIDAANRP